MGLRLEILQQLLQAVDLRFIFLIPGVERERKGVLDTDDRVAIDAILRKGVHPAQDRLVVPAAKDEFLHTVGDPLRGQLPLLSPDHVIHGFFNMGVGVQPPCSPHEALPGLLRRRSAICLAEKFADQMMKAYPLPGSIQGNQKEVARSQAQQRLFGVIGICDGSSERCADAIEHRDSEHDVASSFVHLRQDHVAQIVNHAGVRAGEVLDERLRLARPGEHQRRELERRRPAFGFGQQGLQIRRRQVSPEAASVELSGFRGVKLQLLGS